MLRSFINAEFLRRYRLSCHPGVFTLDVFATLREFTLLHGGKGGFCDFSAQAAASALCRAAHVSPLHDPLSEQPKQPVTTVGDGEVHLIQVRENHSLMPLTSAFLPLNQQLGSTAQVTRREGRPRQKFPVPLATYAAGSRGLPEGTRR